MKLEKYENIILDCDGVIFDSNNLKIQAFSKTIGNFDINLVKPFITYLKKNFGNSRYKIFKDFIKNYTKITLNNNAYDELLNDYSHHCISLYKRASFTEGFCDFLKKYNGKNFFVASGSDQKELNYIFSLRKIDKYFKKIYGSPKPKDEILGQLVIHSQKSIMIGDAKADLMASKKNKIDFIFMSQYSTDNYLKNNKNLIKIKNLRCLI